MPVLLIRHKVADFESWKRVFLEEAGTRQANGARSEHVFRNATDLSEVWTLFEWDDLFRARLFTRSDDLIESFVRAGVADHPDVWFLEDAIVPEHETPLDHHQ